MVYVFVYSVVKCVGVQPIARMVQPIIRRSKFCSGVLKIRRIEEFPWGLKETVRSEKYILQPRAHNSILPMSVDTLPLKLQNGTLCSDMLAMSECLASSFASVYSQNVPINQARSLTRCCGHIEPIIYRVMITCVTLYIKGVVGATPELQSATPRCSSATPSQNHC